MKYTKELLDMIQGRKYLRRKETTKECIELIKEGVEDD